MARKDTGRSAIRKSQLCSMGVLVAALMAAGIARAETVAFDLSGPRVAMKVTRSGKSLPISEVPNLQAGDRLWIQPELPADQSVHPGGHPAGDVRVRAFDDEADVDGLLLLR